MQQIPRAGNINFSLLLQKSPSTWWLGWSNASIQEPEPLVRWVVAQQIHAFFTQSKWPLASHLTSTTFSPLYHKLPDTVFIFKKQEKGLWV
jgi:hypothetical protein